MYVRRKYCITYIIYYMYAHTKYSVDDFFVRVCMNLCMRVSLYMYVPRALCFSGRRRVIPCTKAKENGRMKCVSFSWLFREGDGKQKVTRGGFGVVLDCLRSTILFSPRYFPTAVQTDAFKSFANISFFPSCRSIKDLTPIGN